MLVASLADLREADRATHAELALTRRAVCLRDVADAAAAPGLHLRATQIGSATDSVSWSPRHYNLSWHSKKF